ncbi:MAG: bifunctional hydroxymethylpyrimidine kinase/phosphomethylpyrimidine kinase [Methanobacterium sp.]|nr:bifunctional hydroxymethylpyrimidine kinase/phosphomethylpyrimidine kinase [Methanobacterium sp.]
MIAISIAGYDPSGGAGILNDIKTFHALGVYGTAVITVLTAQNPNKIAGIESVSTDFIEKQLETILEDYPVKHVKTGMLYSKENIKLISDKVVDHKLKLVVDPVMIASCGASLTSGNLAKSIKKYLLPNTILTTPNIEEAEKLSGINIHSIDDAMKAAEKIGKICNVIITGGHLNGSNIFFNGSVKVIKGDIIESENIHGTGCSYSAAVTASLVKGYNLLQSIEIAGEFVKNSVINGEWGTLNQLYELKL